MRACRRRDNADPDLAPADRTRLWNYLIVDKPHAEKRSLLETELAALPGDGHRTCRGRAVKEDVMGTFPPCW
jgi:hypothetical protein